MDLTIKIQIDASEALIKALAALGCLAGKGERKHVTQEGVSVIASRTSEVAKSEAPTAPAAPSAPAAPAAPAAPTKVDAAAEVRKVMSATRSRLGAKAGSQLYASLNAEFVRTARQLGAEKPTALPAEKVGEFKQICDTIMLDADGESLAPPF